MTDDPSLPAGEFPSWLAAAERGTGSEVPCDGCTACCTSSYFVHVEPDEAATLARIPAALRFPAPGLPQGHVVLPYDEHGRCPMLGDGGCTIYEDRPRTCREYDCRVFAAAGVDPGEQQVAIGRRARAWRFGYPGGAGRAEHEAVRRAAAFLEAHGAELPDDLEPGGPTGTALLAVGIHRLFLGGATPTAEEVGAAISGAGTRPGPPGRRAGRPSRSPAPR